MSYDGQEIWGFVTPGPEDVAEAVAAERQRLAEAVRGLDPWGYRLGGTVRQAWGIVDRAAVLALLEDKP